MSTRCRVPPEKTDLAAGRHMIGGETPSCQPCRFRRPLSSLGWRIYPFRSFHACLSPSSHVNAKLAKTSESILNKILRGSEDNDDSAKMPEIYSTNMNYNY